MPFFLAHMFMILKVCDNHILLFTFNNIVIVYNIMHACAVRGVCTTKGG